MADKKISELTAHTTVLDNDIFPVVTGGATKKISRNDLLCSTPVNGMDFADGLIFTGDMQGDSGSTCEFYDTEIYGNLKQRGKAPEAGYGGQHAIMPCSNHAMTDNIDSPIAKFSIQNYSTAKDYVWGISFVFEGQIVGYTSPSNTPHEVTCQMYKISANAWKKLTANTVNQYGANFTEDVEPPEAATSPSSLKAYTTGAVITYPAPEEIVLNLKCNFTGTIATAGNADFYSHGFIRVFHFCHNRTDDVFEPVTISDLIV